MERIEMGPRDAGDGSAPAPTTTAPTLAPPPPPEDAPRDAAVEDAADSLADLAAHLERGAAGGVAATEVVRRPGDVRINVSGAFIADGDSEGHKSGEESEEGEEVVWFDTEGGYEHEQKDIRLPNHREVVSHVAVDIGGSLAKLVYFSFEPGDVAQGGRLNFLKFETEKIDVCIAFMLRLKAEHRLRNGDGPGQDLCVMATGGGAYKYYDKIREALGVEVLREDEMECLIIGLDFFIHEIPREVFTYSDNEANPTEFVEPDVHNYPYLLVNIGSGVSMLKVSAPRKYERVGGTSLGGGTLWGILSLLTGARDFSEMLSMAERGDNTAVDMLVGDIYGSDYGKIGLRSTTIASSFGKVYRMKRQAEREAEDHGEAVSLHTFKPEDISKSLLYAVSNNIGQIAYLHAEKHNCEHIYFGGSFIGGHWQTMATLSFAIKFWSKGKKNAYFLRHEGYLGAVGAFLKRQPPNWGRRNSLDSLYPHTPLAKVESTEERPDVKS
ncbi:fumble-domain-containing protein [Trichodelitschia bisporula]|uniref:Fumble-domain-containing protein n=1 Tax=Trichodelitschia bisporula TaxID=703511 RepID=A0A6G1HRK2_9PEZI|nr:fumble-domain-containing protein [Trichodelitschia bisporula]